ncbi:hypothetical protein [Flavobacterium sp.]|uniref:hypothetical protein n=1 Tax=Flavobacterium sp. TaxID=239 RepID=UPI003D6A37CC
MFGIVNKINEHSLYLLNDMVENQVRAAEKELANCPAENTERIDFLMTQIGYYKSELQKFKDNVENQRKEKFQFSIEELYAMYGQYERKYISVEFHKFSESATKFGRNIAGVIVYSKAEREVLENLINSDVVPRTNDYVKFDFSKSETISDELRHELLNTGFKSGDIYEILASDYPMQKAFNQPGQKEIPNTIEVKIDPSGFDINRSTRWLLGQKIKSGYKLTDIEWAKFCGLSIYLEPESIEVNIIKENAFDENGNKKYLVRFYELEAKLYSKDITGEEIMEFNEFLKTRKSIRIESIVREIKRSTNKTIEKFKSEYPEIYEEIEISRIQFDDETLVYHNVIIPIFWDYESYLHIYLRHCDELGIEGHFENKTKFQYTQKDIRRILVIAIEKLLPQINEKLKANKEFRIYGDKSLYFNGNHYSLHILANGKVAAFHPLENPTK